MMPKLMQIMMPSLASSVKISHCGGRVIRLFRGVSPVIDGR